VARHRFRHGPGDRPQDRHAKDGVVSRVHRASTAAALAYLQFGISLVLGIVLVPFVLGQVGVRLYGFWLASGEVLAYAAMADFGILAALPWMIAEADGRGDRPGMRRLISTGFCAALMVSVVYLGVVLLLWQVAPAILRLQPEEREAIAGPLALIACASAMVLPLRIGTSTLMALQDVKAFGALAACSRLMEVVLVVTLLLQGYGLYALAIAAAAPSLLVAIVAFIRLRMIAPDLLQDWPRPRLAEIGHLFKEGSGAWFGAWSWRLTAAADAVILTNLGSPVWVAVLAMTSKLGQLLTHMSWVPGDSGLVGLANLAGERKPERLRAAVTALLRVYLALVTAGACVILAVNAPFVQGWLGPELFGGLRLNLLVACLMLVLTTVHGLAAVASVLGHRRQVGAVSLGAALVQVTMAYLLTRRFGLLGVPLAAILTQTLLLLPALVWAMPGHGVKLRGLATNVLRPWMPRALPLLTVSAVAGLFLSDVPLTPAIALGALTGVLSLWICRGLLLDYPPVATMIRARLALLRLDGLLNLSPAPRPPLS
jgi:O-antigen/teichoic acid export membrane protein